MHNRFLKETIIIFMKHQTFYNRKIIEEYLRKHSQFRMVKIIKYLTELSNTLLNECFVIKWSWVLDFFRSGKYTKLTIPGSMSTSSVNIFLKSQSKLFPSVVKPKLFQGNFIF